jgi:hypothetical protein
MVSSCMISIAIQRYLISLLKPTAKHMKKCSIFLIIISIIIIGLTSFTCEREIVDDNPTQGTLQPVSDGEIITHQYFSLAYSESHEAAIWVSYHLTPDHINGDAERKDNFKPDPLVSTGSAELKDYVGSGYDIDSLEKYIFDIPELVKQINNSI